MKATKCLCQERPELAATLSQAIASLRFGAIELVIHEGRVVQLERHEKIRLDRSTARSTQTFERADH